MLRFDRAAWAPESSTFSLARSWQDRPVLGAAMARWLTHCNAPGKMRRLTMSDPPRTSRLASIDLLRGLAALAVVCCHSYDGRLTEPWWLRHLLLPITYGSSGVYLFFVISGFCIHMRWASDHAKGVSRPIDFTDFWKRRLKRLYPAYFVTLVLCLWIPTRGQPVANPAPAVWDIVSHLLLIHSIDSRTVASINGVFWTLAVEEQLYLLYFALLWLRNHYGWMITLGVTLLVRVGWMALSFLAEPLLGIDIVVYCSAQAAWCIWALGAIAVEASLGIITLPSWMRSKLLALALFTLGAAYPYAENRWALPNTGFHQIAYGLCAFVLVNSLIGHEATLRLKTGATIRAGLWLGAISYSLYLLHLLVFAVTNDGIVGIVASIVAAAVFYRVLEKPFMTKARPARELHGGTPNSCEATVPKASLSEPTAR